MRVFGANSEDRRNYYGTDFKDALRKLGTDLNEFVLEENIQQQANSGDGGLDLVGHVNFQDPARGSFALFGQCAAREHDWAKKSLEAHPIRFGAFINFTHFPGNVFFIPLCYRDARGEWVKNSPASGCILIDRLRMCNLLKGNDISQEVSTLLTEGEMAVT